MSEARNADRENESDDNYTFDQTYPVRLTNWNGCDHSGHIKISFDESYLPDDADVYLSDDMNWAIRAVNAVIHYPNLVLWVRTSKSLTQLGQVDLVIAHEPHESHEQAGHLRTGTFRQSGRTRVDISTASEIDAGLITPFDAVNVLYDYIVGASHHGEYSMVLADVQYLEHMDAITHPIVNIDDDITDWGQRQLLDGAFPRPIGRDRTAYPETAYPQSDEQCYDGSHDHASDVLNEHINAFERDP